IKQRTSKLLGRLAEHVSPLLMLVAASRHADDIGVGGEAFLFVQTVQRRNQLSARQVSRSTENDDRTCHLGVVPCCDGGYSDFCPHGPCWSATPPSHRYQ